MTFWNEIRENYYIFALSNNQYFEKMKKLILLLVLPLFAAMQITAQTSQPAAAAPAPQVKAAAPVNPNAPIAKWDKTVEDFGSIAFGVPKTAEFTLTNAGKEALVINDAKASCGCTNLKYSKEPVMPGSTTTVSATYNAANAGSFTKTITVNTNADATPVFLQIKGIVLPNPNPPPAPAPAPAAAKSPATAPAAPAPAPK